MGSDVNDMGWKFNNMAWEVNDTGWKSVIWAKNSITLAESL